MRRFVLLCIAVASTLPAFGQRLPEIARPVNYQLTFAPDFKKDNFSGQESITIDVLKQTSTVVLNAAEIEFRNATITSGGITQTAKVALDPQKQMATLTVEKPISPGKASISIHYSGILNDALRGFYLGRDEQGRKYAVTQFEATDARRAFPSFDEPSYKATFDITVIADKKHTVISNSKIVSDQPGPIEGKHTVKFATTPTMSSYLVAMAVGEFEAVEGQADGVPIRVWGTPGKKQLGTFALQGAESFLHYFNQYFGIKYPYEKLDLIGLPDFAAGAMENTACITFRDVELLIDEQHASLALKREVAAVVAHEMAHMWFGDLVTMQWWDDLWLNEGFATWMESKPVKEWKPEWHVELDDVRDTVESLNVDSLRHTRPIQQTAETPDQIQELFDGIAYGKTAAVLRMVEAYIGPEKFRAGVNQYLKEHTYGNATAADFWGTLARASGKPVDKFLPTFVRQAGVPFVDLQAECAENVTRVTLRQQRYVFDRQRFASDSWNELWQIPVCLKEGGGSTATEAQSCHLLTQKQDTFELPGCSAWTLGNAGANGFYRSGYAAGNLRSMALDLESGLTPGERIMLLGDTWAAVRIGKQPISDWVALAKGLQYETSRQVMDSAMNQIEYLGTYLTSAEDRQQYQAWVRQLLAPTIQRLGFETKAGESDDDRELRARVLTVAGATGHDPAALAWARKSTEQLLSASAVSDYAIAGTALSLAAQDGDAALYDRIEQKQRQAKTPEEYYVYAGALASFSDPKLIDRTLQRALSAETRSQDATHVISSMMYRASDQEQVWEFVKSHWVEIDRIAGGIPAADIVAATSSFCTAEMHDQVQEFFSVHQVPTAQRGLQQSLERIENCVDLKEQQTSRLAEWLNERENRSGQ